MNIIFIFSMICLTQLSSAQSQDCANCDSAELPTSNILTGYTNPNDWAATDQDFIKAKCQKKTPYTLEELNTWINKNVKTGIKTNENVFGFNFSDDSGLINAFKQLTKYSEWFADSKDQKHFSSKCSTVACGLKELFGVKEGAQLLFLLKKYNFNGSHISYNNASKWKAAELDDILLAFTAFPERKFPLKNEGTYKLIHFKRGYTRDGDDSTLANASIEIFDYWNEHTRAERQLAIVHELGHVIANHFDADEDKAWLDLGRWTKTINPKTKEIEWSTSNLKIIPSIYGATNPWEHFAEAVVAYRYSPQLLKTNSPQTFNIIKSLAFDGVNYLDKNACNEIDNISPLAKKVCEKSSSDYLKLISDNNSQEAKQRKSEIINNCHESVLEYISKSLKPITQKSLYTCYYEKMKNQAFNYESIAQSSASILSPLESLALSEKTDSCYLKAPPELLVTIANEEINLIKDQINKSLKSCNTNNSYYQDNCQEWAKACGSHSFLDDKRQVEYGDYSNAIETYAYKICATIKKNRNKFINYFDDNDLYKFKFKENEIDKAIQLNPL